MTAQRALLALPYEEVCTLHFTTSEVPAYDLNIPTLMMMLHLYAVNSTAMAHLSNSIIPHSYDSLVGNQTPHPNPPTPPPPRGRGGETDLEPPNAINAG